MGTYKNEESNDKQQRGVRHQQKPQTSTIGAAINADPHVYSILCTSPRSVTAWYRYRIPRYRISKYRYRYGSRYFKYRKIPNTEKNTEKTINRYFNFAITALLVIRVYAHSMAADSVVSFPVPARSVSSVINFTTKSVWQFDNPCCNPILSCLKFLY